MEEGGGEGRGEGADGREGVEGFVDYLFWGLVFVCMGVVGWGRQTLVHHFSAPMPLARP